MRRRNVPCSPCSGGSSGSCGCCGLKEKLHILWDRTIGSILRINGITPDGNGDFEIEAGSNIALSQTGTGNGIRIDTTGGVSYYTAGDQYIDVDNNDLEISLVTPGQSGGVALQDDLDTVINAVTSILTALSVSSGNIPVYDTEGTSSSFMYYFKYGQIVVITYVLYPINTGVRTFATSPFRPTNIVYYSSVDAPSSGCRSSLIDNAGNVRVTVLSGDSNISGTVVFTTSD